MECWDDYIKLAKWLFAKKNIAFSDDDSQNCYLIFVRCQKNHDAHKSSFKTYLTHSINNYIKKKKSTEYKKNTRESGCLDTQGCYEHKRSGYKSVMRLILSDVMLMDEKKHIKVFYRRHVLNQPISYINKLYGLKCRATYDLLWSAKVSLRRILHTNEVDVSLLYD